jgi:Cu/Ag efflux protein CusF
MKNILIAALVTVAAVGFSAQGVAAEHDHGEHGTMHAQGNTDAPLIEGMVKRVDKGVGKVTVSHGPLPNGMPAMTMAFGVKDAAWLDQLKSGDKIRFAASPVNDVATIVRIELAK